MKRGGERAGSGANKKEEHRKIIHRSIPIGCIGIILEVTDLTMSAYAEKNKEKYIKCKYPIITESTKKVAYYKRIPDSEYERMKGFIDGVVNDYKESERKIVK